MPLRSIAITGSRGSGKSTFFKAVIDRMSNNGVPFSGFKTFFVKPGTLWLEWIHLEHRKIQLGKKTGQSVMKPFLENLDIIGEILLEQDFESNIFVADEIGFLEQFSKQMQRGIIKAISDAPFSFFTMRMEEYPFLKCIRKIEGLQVVDLDGCGWQQKEEILQRCLKTVR